MAVEVTKELDSKEAVEHPEEDKEQSHIVDLLARPLEDLVEPGLGHRELEAGPNVSDHENNVLNKYCVSCVVFAEKGLGSVSLMKYNLLRKKLDGLLE